MKTFRIDSNWILCHLKKICFYFVSECFACMYVSALHIFSALGSQKRASDTLKPELLGVVSGHVSADG